MAAVRVATPLAIALPGQNAPLTADPQTQPQAPWWQVWRGLVLRTGGNNGIDSALLQSILSNVETLMAMWARPTPLPPLPLPITPGPSPFSYQAPFDGVVLIHGGIVSAVTFSRDGSTTFAYPASGEVRVTQGDVVTTTYSGVPTMTMIGHR